MCANRVLKVFHVDLKICFHTRSICQGELSCNDGVILFTFVGEKPDGSLVQFRYVAVHQAQNILHAWTAFEQALILL